MSFDWLKAACFYNSLENKNGKIMQVKNSRFDKRDCFHVLVISRGYFRKEIENIFSRVSYVTETLVEGWDRTRNGVPTSISRSPKVPLVRLFISLSLSILRPSKLLTTLGYLICISHKGNQEGNKKGL